MRRLPILGLPLAVALWSALASITAPVKADSPQSGPARDVEVKAIVAGTYLARDVLGEHDTPDVLRRVLKKGAFSQLDEPGYVTLLEETVRENPLSRVAHEALANTLIEHRGESAGDFEHGVRELKRAAELSFDEGLVRYEGQLPSYLAITGDEEGLHRYAEQAFALLPEGPDRFSVYLYYAHALARLKSPLTDEMFARAIAVRPAGDWSPYEFYLVYLKENKKYETILSLLTPAVLRDAEIMRDFFQRSRCEALRAVGRQSAVKAECSGKAQQQRPTSVGATGMEKTDFPHNSSTDDCRSQAGCLYHPTCPTPGYC